MLTTPKLKGFDSVFPGEKWFFYWRTSASLWESKLAEHSVGSYLFIPINWGLHTENPDQYDFGDLKPEADLKKLISICEKLSIKVTFVISFSPSPFLSNGGIPSYLAKTHCTDERGLYQFAIDSNGKINKLFSFFNPRVFQYFQKFLVSLKKYIDDSSSSPASYVGMNSFYFDGEKAESLFLDYSKDFESGLQRYINQSEKLESAADVVIRESELKAEYVSLVKDLYIQFSAEHFGDSFLGVKDYLFFGADPASYAHRSFSSWKDSNHYFDELFFSLTHDFVPSSVLIGEEERSQVLDKSLFDNITADFFKENIFQDYYNEDDNEFKQFSLFKVENLSHHSFIKLGLKQYFDNHYKWSYKFNQQLDLENLEDYSVFITSLNEIKKDSFHFMLKAFMCGHSVFMDENGSSDDTQRKLNLFLSENSIETETVNIGAKVTLAKLGEGRLFLFNSMELESRTIDDKFGFWHKLFNSLDLKHIDCVGDDELYYFWKTRFSNNYELNYEQIRRISIYNPSSYKKKMKIKAHENFAFVKTIDENEVQVKSTNSGVELEIKPGGNISLDYGYFDK